MQREKQLVNFNKPCIYNKTPLEHLLKITYICQKHVQRKY